MMIDGAIVHYLLAEEFDVAESGTALRSLLVDYPILFDSTADMSGHTVLIPEHERPHAGLSMEGALCVCMGEESAASARDAGLVVLLVRGVTFQRLYNFMQETFVRMERMDAQMRAYVDTNAGFQPLVGVCAQTMGCSCALVDEGYRVVCSYAFGGGSSLVADEARSAAGLIEPDVVDLFMASSDYHRMRKSRHVFAMPGASSLFMKNLFMGTELVGTLVFEHSENVLHARYVRALLGYLGSFVEEMYARMGTYGLGAPSSDRVRLALCAHVVDGAANADEIAALLSENGHGESSRYAVLRIERTFTNEGAVELDYLARRFQVSWPYGYCIVVGDSLLLLADVTERKAQGEGGYLAGLLVVARDNLSKVGVSREFSDMGQLRGAWVQACIAFEYGMASQPTRWCYRFDDYAFDWLLRNARGEVPVEYVCHSGVSALLRYDEEHGSELLPTLLEFLRCRYNATQAADALFIARSTLLHRLDRINAIAHIDLDDLRERVYLEVSLAMLQSVSGVV